MWRKAKQIINVLLLTNFYPVISYGRVQKGDDELLYTVTRYGPQSVASAQFLSIPFDLFNFFVERSSFINNNNNNNINNK